MKYVGGRFTQVAAHFWLHAQLVDQITDAQFGYQRNSSYEPRVARQVRKEQLFTPDELRTLGQLIPACVLRLGERCIGTTHTGIESTSRCPLHGVIQLAQPPSTYVGRMVCVYAAWIAELQGRTTNRIRRTITRQRQHTV